MPRDRCTTPHSSARRDMRCAKFIRELNRDGWTLDYDSRAGGCRTVQFSKFFGQRQVEVQLWEDGGHRATHMLYRDRAKRMGRMTTPPTNFRDIDGMWRAVKYERTRTDQKP